MALNTGAISPGTMADDATVGTKTWSNPDNAKVSDNVYATVAKTSVQVTHYLKATNFGFSIPTGATINGIMVEGEGKTASGNLYSNVRIIKGGTILTNAAFQRVYTTTEQYLSHGNSTSLWSNAWTPSDINDSGFGCAFYSNDGVTDTWSVDHIRITVYYTERPTVTTQAVSSVGATTATGNGNITALGGENADERGIVYSTTTHGDPGNVSPASSSYSGLVNETGGSFGTGAFTESLTGLTSRTTYYARAYAHNSAGYSYGSEVNFTTIGFTSPANIYSSNNVYATLAATSGILTVEVSKDAGANWQTPKTVTFTASDTLQTVGLGATELFGSSFTRADMVDANFRVRLSQGNISQVYKTFGFSTGSDILTGIEIAIEGNYTSPTMSLDLLEVKIFYGTSILPVQAGSQAYASNGRKAGEGAGAGTGLLTYFDGTNWIASDTGATVSA